MQNLRQEIEEYLADRLSTDVQAEREIIGVFYCKADIDGLRDELVVKEKLNSNKNYNYFG